MSHGWPQGIYAKQWDPYGWPSMSFDPVSDVECWKCGQPNPDLSHAINEYVAAIIGHELLRRVEAEMVRHAAEHGCDAGFWRPRECIWPLFDLIPDGLRPIAIG